MKLVSMSGPLRGLAAAFVLSAALGAPAAAEPSVLGAWHETLPQPMPFGVGTLALRSGGHATCTYYYVSTPQHCTGWRFGEGTKGRVIHLALTDGTSASSVDLRYRFSGGQLWLVEDAPVAGEGAVAGTWTSKLSR